MTDIDIRALIAAERQEAAAAEQERIRLALLRHFRSARPHLCASMLEGGKCGAGTWDDLIGGPE